MGRTISGATASLFPARKFAGRAPKLNSITPPPAYGDKALGTELLAGRWAFANQSVDVGAHGHPFSVSMPSERFAGWVHDFDWLDDLLAVSGGAEKAGQLTAQWAGAFTGGNSFVFAPDRLARRGLNWGRVLSALPDPTGQLAARYAGQMRLLRRAMKRFSPGLPQLRAQAALVIFGARLSNKAKTVLARALDGLDEEIALQILADGGHISRSPMATLDALDILLGVDRILQAAGLEGSRVLGRAIDRLVPMVATLRHTDGGLAVFHGGHEGNPNRVSSLMQSRGGEAGPQPFAYGPHTGYHRLDAGESVVLIDTQGVAPRPHDLESHLAPLAMEISTAEGRLLVNCGWHPGAAPDWRRPVRSSAAHSTLTLADRSPGEILKEGFMANALGAVVAKNSGVVRARRKEQTSGIWLESSHFGYKDAHGLVHRRRLFVGEDGGDIRGEDSLFVPMGTVPLSRETVPFALRFHFHPDVRVSLAQDLLSALLVQNDRSGWRFRTDCGPLAIEPSVYLGGGARPVRCQQLVISGKALSDGDGQGRDNRVRWSLRRLRGRTS